MSRRRKSHIKYLTFSLVPIVLVVMALLAGISANNADATSPTDWTKVKGYINAYISNQYTAGDEGETGFVASAASLNYRINSLNDSTILGEGDDAANAPVLVDNLGGNADYIPGTSTRCAWNSGAGLTGNIENCFDQAVIDAVKARADAHAAAGFSTDIIDYCQSGHTQSASTGAFGYIAQTGALRSDGSIPKVYGLKWGRNGWTNSIAGYTATNPIAAAAAASTYTPPTTNPAATACNSTVSDAELVRCQAQQSIYNGTVNGMTGGNVGSGQSPAGTSPAQTLTTGGIVDIRTGSPGSTVSGTSGGAVQIPLNTLFTTGLVNVNPTATNGILVGSRTPMVGGIAAEGLKMLGYGMSTGGFIRDGLPRWNNTLNEKQVTDGLTRAALIPTATAIDTIAPTISSSSATATGKTTADVSRTTSEPATSKIALTGSGGAPAVNVNNTVLNATKTTTLTGLVIGTTYTGTLTVYDGQANSASTPISFTTPAPFNPATDKAYYTPWYDTMPAYGWVGDWIGVVNVGIVSANVEIRIGGVPKATQTILAGEDWSPTPVMYPNLIAGPVEVICLDCRTSGASLVVNQRALYQQTFSEILAVEYADLANEYVFPWYDNKTANNVVGDWIMVTNTDGATTATVDIFIGDMVTPVTTLAIAPGVAANYRDLTGTLMGGPVKVRAQGTQKLIVSQRVLYKASFNEVLGQRAAGLMPV